MPRPQRHIIPKQPIHVVQRGNNREAIFTDAADFQVCLSLLHSKSEYTRCAIHAYVLMTNHLHLLLTPEDEIGPSRLMQSLGVNYVRYFNERYGRTGTLWESRFRSSAINSVRYFFECSRYIELNPVRAHMVGQPAEYPWSSFRNNAMGVASNMVRRHELYHALRTTGQSCEEAYQELFRAHLDVDVCDTIRRAYKTGKSTG